MPNIQRIRVNTVCEVSISIQIFGKPMGTDISGVLHLLRILENTFRNTLSNCVSITFLKRPFNFLVAVRYDRERPEHVSKLYRRHGRTITDDGGLHTRQRRSESNRINSIVFNHEPVFHLYFFFLNQNVCLRAYKTNIL